MNPPASSPASRWNWLARLDQFAEHSSDILNPILVKEARQALKSRQFSITFSLLLAAAWGWTLYAIRAGDPGIYYVPSGKSFLFGYYFVLAIPMLVVVPIAAHRSLASEVDDGTLDLLTVTNLSPLQIIFGKLASASLQMMLYFVVLLPCVAFAYVLRGVDVLSIAAIIGVTISVGFVLTLVGLFLASLPRGRTGQLTMLIIMIVLVGIAIPSMISIAQQMIFTNVFAEGIKSFAIFSLMAILLTISFGLLLLRTAAAELSPPSENRSTPIRWALLGFQTTVLGCLTFTFMTSGRNDPILILAIFAGTIFWVVIGALMVGEGTALTPRVRRDLPGSFLARSMLTWWTPGPATGLVFSVTALITFCVYLLMVRVLAAPITANTTFVPTIDPLPYFFTLIGYAMLALTLTRLAMKLVRLHSNTHPSVSLAVLVIVIGSLALIPYAIGLLLNDYRTFSWNYGQLTNSFWTLATLESGSLPELAPYLVFAIGGISWLIALATTGQRALPLRVATPARVQEEIAADQEKSATAEQEIDPLAG